MEDLEKKKYQKENAANSDSESYIDPEPRWKTAVTCVSGREQVLKWVNIGVLCAVFAFAAINAIFGFLPFLFPHAAMIIAYAVGAMFFGFCAFLIKDDAVKNILSNAAFAVCALGIFFGGIISAVWVNLIIGILIAAFPVFEILKLLRLFFF